MENILHRRHIVVGKNMRPLLQINGYGGKRTEEVTAPGALDVSVNEGASAMGRSSSCNLFNLSPRKALPDSSVHVTSPPRETQTMDGTSCGGRGTGAAWAGARRTVVAQKRS
jgi:hypothetical protein